MSIAKDAVDRWTLYPIRHHDLWAAYKTHVAMFWTPEEIDMSVDRADFEDKLRPPEQKVVKNILAFFAFSDGAVLENCMCNFAEHVTFPEARQFYAMQALSEAVHQETYALLLQTLIRDEPERLRLFRLVESSPALGKKADFMIRHMNGDAPLALRLVAFAVVEGVFFCASFACIFWLKTRGHVLPGFVKANEFIARDESAHRDFAILLAKKLGLPSAQAVQDLVREGCDLEVAFMAETLDTAVLGLDGEAMADYIRFVADHLLESLGVDRVYGVRNPLPFMDALGMEGKTNFFEARVSEYALSTGPRVFSTTEDF